MDDLKSTGNWGCGKTRNLVFGENGGGVGAVEAAPGGAIYGSFCLADKFIQ